MGVSWNGEYSPVDGAYFRLSEPYPFQKSWYSQKLSAPALRYEISVRTVDDIV